MREKCQKGEEAFCNGRFIGIMMCAGTKDFFSDVLNQLRKSYNLRFILRERWKVCLDDFKKFDFVKEVKEERQVCKFYLKSDFKFKEDNHN